MIKAGRLVAKNIISNYSKGILETIEEQSIGMAAERSEK